MPQARRKGKDGDAAGRPQDPLVERLRPDPSEPPQPVIVLEGLLGDSDREGYRRLYLTRALDYYAEFRAADVIDIATIEPDQPPFLGETASRVTLPRDAPIDFTRSVPARAADEFDLDVRLGPSRLAGPAALTPDCAVLPPTRQFTDCLPFTCDTCLRTQCEYCLTRVTCKTCETQCGTCDTCVRTRCQTCVTCFTCETCPTQCDTCTLTCATCQTQCETCLRTVCDGCLTQDRTCDTCGIACTAVGCQTLDTCGVACTAVGCQTLDTCGIACTAVRCDTLVC
jgi:hypothetical protein